MGKKKKPATTSESSDDVTKPPPSKKVKVEEPVAEWIEPVTTEQPTTKKEEQKQETEKLQLLVAAFSAKQQDQYEVFRRATFQKGTVRRLMQNVCGITMSQNVVIAMSGMAKVLVGELMELGCQARDSRGETGPLQPKHIREATRKMRQSNRLPNSRPKSSVSYS